MLKKSVIHQSSVKLVREFDEAWKLLRRRGEVVLRTEKNRKPFIAKTRTAERGKHAGQRIIMFLNYKTRKDSAYVFRCCWSHHTNCYGSGSRIGMYCQALDNYLTPP